MESRLQRRIITWLKQNGFYVIKTRPGFGTPVGCLDIIALKQCEFVAIEVKASSTSPFRPGQKSTIDYLSRGNEHIYVAYPENWEYIKQKIVSHFC